MTPRSRSVRTFGDFQTPDALAAQVIALLRRRQVDPRGLFEPTCGEGAFLRAARAIFPEIAVALGVEIDPTKAARARADGVTIEVASIFDLDLPALLRPLPDPLLLVGNPPWVTNAALGALGSDNRPRRDNDGRSGGLAAKTGKSNFDLAEWILLHLLDAVRSRDATLSFLCKTTTARRVLSQAWKRGLGVREATLHRIDAPRWFGAAVDACLFTCRTGTSDSTCAVFPSLDDEEPTGRFGWSDGALVADVDAYARMRHLHAREESEPKWRSGIKHDCASVMEIDDGVRARLEDLAVFPMLKGGELDRQPTRSLIVPQRALGEDTATLAQSAPRTFAYLVEHGERLDRRASSIYRGRPRFCVFGVGPYSFAPWKVAISALHKRLQFHVVGPHRDKPVVFDDTVYFLPCATEQEARSLHARLSSEPAQSFYRALVFWDAKRPITAEVLRRFELR